MCPAKGTVMYCIWVVVLITIINDDVSYWCIDINNVGIGLNRDFMVVRSLVSGDILILLMTELYDEFRAWKLEHTLKPQEKILLPTPYYSFLNALYNI